MAVVSIIVPVFNKEHYLERGVRSLLAQTLEDIEIILVNDGSTDGSLMMLKSLAKSDPRIRLISQRNAGVSEARNTGIKEATGTYIGFLDPDDWAEKDMYQSMAEKIHASGAEIILCNYYFEKEGSSLPVSLGDLPLTLAKDEILNDLILSMLFSDPRKPYEKETMGSAFRLLLKRDFVLNEVLAFVPGLAYMEDLVFTVDSLSRASRVSIDRGFHYHYQVHPASASRKYMPDLFDHLLVIMGHLEHILRTQHLYDRARERLEQRMLFNAVRAVINEVHDLNPSSYEERIQKIRRIASHPGVLNVLPKLEKQYLPQARLKTLEYISEGRYDDLYRYFAKNRYALEPGAPTGKKLHGSSQDPEAARASNFPKGC